MVQWKITLNERVQPTNGDIPFSTYSHDYGKRWVFNYGQGSSTPINNPLFLMVINPIPSLKLTFSPLKMDGWNTILSYWGPGLFSEARVVGLKIPFFCWGFSDPKSSRLVGPLARHPRYVLNGAKMWITNGTVDGQETGDAYLVGPLGPLRGVLGGFIIPIKWL